MWPAEPTGRSPKDLRLICKPTVIDALPICAGVIGLPPKDGADQQLKINHFGPFLLTSLLLPKLAQNARIVNVASRAHKQGSLKISNSTIEGISLNW